MCQGPLGLPLPRPRFRWRVDDRLRALGVARAAAAHRLFRQALPDPAHPRPRVINTDRARRYGAAIASMQQEGIRQRRGRPRPVHYVHTIVEPDHRAITGRVNATQGFRDVQAARRTIQGYEVVAAR